MFSTDVLNVVAVGNTMKNQRHSSFNAKTTCVRNVKKNNVEIKAKRIQSKFCKWQNQQNFFYTLDSVSRQVYNSLYTMKLLFCPTVEKGNNVIYYFVKR
jgi:hypothetical protein